ncbi:MAG TPA: hypothetical protein VM284_01380 [Candidatus Limnocylindria bacterium]|nr:hypothetical protein [Candidatus Limnocylindria bacterium]
MIASDRVLRLLCWALIVFALATAALQLTVSQNPFGTPVDDSADLVDRLLSYRSDDQKVLGLALISGVVGTGLFVVGSLLGLVLRRLAPSGAAGDVMAGLFVVGGIAGVVSQLMYLGNANLATFGYCDCGYKTYEVIAQDYALSAAWTLQSWVNVGAIVIVGLAVAFAGWVVNLSRDWRILSYLIAFGSLLGAALRIFGANQTSDVALGLTAGLAVPMWAFLLARGSGRLAART